MKIKTQLKSENPQGENVSEYVFRIIHKDDLWGSNNRAIANQSVAIGRMVNLLAEKGILTAPEVTSLVEYERKTAEFVPW